MISVTIGCSVLSLIWIQTLWEIVSRCDFLSCIITGVQVCTAELTLVCGGALLCCLWDNGGLCWVGEGLGKAGFGGRLICIDNLTHSLSVRVGHATATYAYTATVEAAEARGTQHICGSSRLCVFVCFVCVCVTVLQRVSCVSSL